MTGSSCTKCQFPADGTTANAPERFCPRLSDGGREFTSYLTRCQTLGPAMSSFDKRKYLIDNADKLINMDRVDLNARLGCAPCYGYDDVGTALPEQSQVECNDKYCTIKITDPCGLGTGRANTSLNVKFDRGVMEVPFYPIDSIPDGKYASCSKYEFFNASK